MDAELIDAFERFRRAIEAHQLCHEADAIGHAELTRTADDIVRARLLVFGCLMRQGWSPPEGIGFQMTADQLLIAQRDDSEQLSKGSSFGEMT